MTDKKAASGRWWHSLKFQECPITLESLATLPYPPFSLKSGESVSYFDGLALASYIVSRGVFQNPLTRQDITMEDCRRLDEYLDSYCQKYQRQYRKVSVAEAFALRSSVHIGQQGRENDRQNQERVQVLRNTATAALAGLFVYGNNRPSYHETDRQHTTTAGTQVSRDDQTILEWGFDLSRTFDNTSENASEGWTVIDDDEALVLATQRDAYHSTQASFPNLDGVTSTSDPPATPVTDDYIIEKVRSVGFTEDRKEALRAQRLELARQRLVAEALRRRKQRQEEKRQLRTENFEEWEKQKQKEEETQRARAEIDAWREEQWEKLRRMSEAKEGEERRMAQLKTRGGTAFDSCCIAEKEKEASKEKEGATEEESAAQKTAKAAAKRKRAKARKKAQKAEERATMEQQKKKEALAAKKAVSKVQCAACSQGIVGSGFEKFGLKFCSTKCARSAKPTL